VRMRRCYSMAQLYWEGVEQRTARMPSILLSAAGACDLIWLTVRGWWLLQRVACCFSILGFGVWALNSGVGAARVAVLKGAVWSGWRPIRLCLLGDDDGRTPGADRAAEICRTSVR